MFTVSCYSYKGGAGRSLLVANLAMLAANLGKKVLALDLDLEAPGLAYKFGVTPVQSPGLVGWLTDRLESGEVPADIDQYLVAVETPHASVKGGSLHLMPAGRAPSENYLLDLRRLRLSERLQAGPGVDAFVDLRAVLDHLGFEVVVIDARTGFTSSNVVATHVLADSVVALSLDMPEQLEGTRSALRSLKGLNRLGSDAPIQTTVVLSRITPRTPGFDSKIRTTEAENEQIHKTLLTLNQPALDLTKTLAISDVMLIHTDGQLTHRDHVALTTPRGWSQSQLKTDYVLIAEQVLGTVLPSLRVQLEQLESDVLPEAEPVQSSEFARAHRDMSSVEKLQIARAMAASNSDFLPMLGSRLVEHGSALGDLGLWTDALEAEREAVEIFAGLSRIQPGRFNPKLAAALFNLSVTLAQLGDHQGSFSANEQSAEIYRQLSKKRPDRYGVRFASSLSSLGDRLSKLGRVDEALQPTKQAVDILVPIARESSKEYDEELADALVNLGARYTELGQLSDALDVTEQAVALRARLADAEPERYTSELADAMSNLTGIYGLMGRPTDAADTGERAVGILTRLASDRPDLHNPALAYSLNNLAGVKNELGLYNEALQAATQAQGIMARLAETDPGRYESGLASALTNLGMAQSEIGDREGAVQTSSQAAVILTRLADANPTVFNPPLARVLANLCAMYSDLGSNERASEAGHRAVEILTDLASNGTERYNFELARALANLGNAEDRLGHRESALAATQQAVDLCAQLAALEPERYNSTLSNVLRLRAHLQRELGDRDGEAVTLAMIDELR